MLNHIDIFLKGKPYYLDNEGITTILNKIKEKHGEQVYLKVKNSLTKELDASSSYDDVEVFKVVYNENKLEDLLKTLKENLVDELNFEDRSVGIYRTTNLKDWAKEDFKNCEGLELVQAEEDNLIFKCEGYTFEIFERIFFEGDEVIDSYWDIRLYEEE